MSEIKEQLQYLKYCLNKRTDVRFRHLVQSVGDNPDYVELKHYGEKETIKPLYHIAMDETKSGFFADFNRLLSFLYYADTYDLMPVVEYSKGFMYAESHPVNGTSNPYEYYFKQPTEYTLDDVYTARCVLQSRKENASLAGQMNSSGRGYDYSTNYIEMMGKIIGKYIRLNEYSEQYISTKIDEYIPNGVNVLGVHVRGTDFKCNYIGHPTVVSIDEYIDATRKAMQIGDYECVYLATDDQNALDRFKDAFGEMLVYDHETVRSAGNVSVMKSNVERDNHHYLLGLEVLADAYILGRCNGLIAGMSQVSSAARMWRRSDGQVYRDETILSKGINLKGEVCK